MKKQKTATIRTEHKQAARRLSEHQETVRQIREAAGASVTADIIRHAILDNGALDVDRLVDLFAKNHRVKDYRSTELQKRCLDGQHDDLVRCLETMSNADATRAIRALLEGWYSRYLLAADVGFELGWGAAQALQGGRR